MRKSRLIAPLLSISTLLLPAFAFASAPTSFRDLAQSVAGMLEDGAMVLIAATIALYFYSIASDIFKMSQGEASGGDFRKTLMWGVIIIFVMVSIWGIIRFLQYSLFGGPPSA